MKLSPERLAYWYFRLNGFTTTENFIVHPDQGANQRTDADLLAVRFAHRAENLVSPMTDDARISSCSTFVNVIIAEIKTGMCSLNGPWTNPAKKNMQRVIKAIGCMRHSDVENACTALYSVGHWSDPVVTVRLFVLGDQHSTLSVPGAQQVTWSEVIQFIISRFKQYRQQKSSLGQWAEDGLLLKKLAFKNRAEALIRKEFALPALSINENAS